MAMVKKLDIRKIPGSGMTWAGMGIRFMFFVASCTQVEEGKRNRSKPITRQIRFFITVPCKIQ
jgi:hypothetical protein